MTDITFDLDKLQVAFTYYGNEVYQVVWSWSLRSSTYPAYKIFLVSDIQP
jgi:hypothetical protein